MRVLRENGLVELPERGKGSHTLFEHPDDPTRHATVPSEEEIGTHLTRLILAQAGKTVEEYLSHLK
jgi:predicted RNA binding protein YcfA (HicA-like mRNA interferase family)